jgi:PAS domain S-box-containing protein
MLISRCGDWVIARMGGKMRLLWKILLLSILVAVVPLTTAGWNIISRIEDELIYSAVSSRMEGLASELAYTVDHAYVREWIGVLSSIARTQQLALLGAPAYVDPKPPLEATVDTYTDFAALQFFPSVDAGYVLTLRSDFAERFAADTAFKSTIHRYLLAHEASQAITAARAGLPYLGNPFEVPGLEGAFLTMALPWQPTPSTRGILIARLSLERLQKEIERRQFDRSGFLCVVDAAGGTISCPGGGPESARITIQSSPVVDSLVRQVASRSSSSWRINRPLSQPVSVSTEIRHRGDDWRVAYATCQSIPWGVIVYEPMKAALRPINAIITDLTVMVLIGLAFAVIGALLLSRTLSRPIGKLTHGAREIGSGNFDHRIALRGHDELSELAAVFNQMARQLKAYDELNVEKLIREKTKTDAILRHIADGVVVTSTEGDILILNEPAEAWFSVREQDVVPRPLTEYINSPELHELVREVSEQADDQVHVREISVSVPGYVRPLILQANATHVVTGSGEPIGTTIVLRDVTAEQEINRMKTEIVSVVAHELRSPLVSIMGYSGILLEKSLNMATRLEFAQIINDESKRLTDLINKFLDISRIEAGRQEVTKVPTDIIDLVNQVTDVNHGLADAQKITLEVTAPRRITPIYIDRDLIGQAVLNLYSNAVKYSPPGSGVTIRIVEHKENVSIAIIDSGFGISRENQRRVFEKFFRVNNDEHVKDMQGSGLGLSLVQEIVEQHSGEISLESVLGEGSTFTVLLPKQWT